MKHILLFMVLAFSACGMPHQAKAQFVVLDPANLVENTITALHELEQVSNQLKQLANEAVMLDNEAKNLEGLHFSSLPQLLAAIAATDQLITQARGLTYNLARSEAVFGEQYPLAYTDATSNAQMEADAHVRWTNSLEALRTTIEAQSQAQTNFGSDQAALTDLINQSQSAVGILQATQATNQLLALHARQSIAEQQLKITQDRATAMEAARAVAAQERAREVRRLFNVNGVPYDPAAGVPTF